MLQIYEGDEEDFNNIYLSTPLKTTEFLGLNGKIPPIILRVPSLQYYLKLYFSVGVNDQLKEMTLNAFKLKTVLI